jgi:hypothetical protein
MNHKVPYFVDILFEELLAGLQGNMENRERVRKVFMNMDSRKLLSFVYVFKVVVKVLRNYVREHYGRFMYVIGIMMEVFDCQPTQMQP